MLEVPSHTSSARPFLWLVIGMSVATMLFLRSMPQTAWVFSDTAHYISTARYIQAGEGIETDLVYYTEQTSSGKIPASQTVFPLGYPAIIAAVASLGSFDLHETARWYCLLSFACIAPLTYLLGLWLRLRPTVAASCAVLWLPLVSAWSPTWCYSSDIPFVVFTLLSILCFARSGRWNWLLAAGLFAAIGVLLRYAGVFLGFAFGVALVLRHRTQVVRLVRDGCLAIGPPLVVALGLFARNAMLAGTWRGGNQSGRQTLFETLKVLYYSVDEYTGFSKTALLEGRIHCIAQVVFLIGLIAAGLYFVWCSRRSLLDKLRDRSLVTLLYGPLAIAILCVVNMGTSTAGVTPRLLIPAVPSVLLCFGALFEWLCNRPELNPKLVFVWIVLGVGGVLAGQSACMADYRQFAARGVATRMILEEPIDDSQTLKQYLQANTDLSATMLSSMPQMTHLLVERPAIGLPSNIYNTSGEPWTFERTLKYVRQYHVKYVLLLTHPDTSGYGPLFFRQLARGEKPDWLELEHNGRHFKLFRTTDCDRRE